MSLPPLSVIIRANTTQFDRALGGAASRLRQFAGPAAVGAAIGALAVMTRRSMQAADEMAKTARSMGLATSALQAMTLVANEAGVSQSQLATSLQNMQRQVVDLERGVATASRAFDTLGLSFRDLQDRSPDEQFRLIAERLSRIEDPALRTATAMEVFGRSGRDVINMLNDYGARIDEATEFQRRFGIAISEVDAGRIEAANDALGRLREAFGGIGNLLASAVSPAIIAFSDRVLGLAGAIADRLRPAQEDFLDQLARVPPSAESGEEALRRYREEVDKTAQDAQRAAEAVGLLNRLMANTPDLQPGLMTGVGTPNPPRDLIEQFLDDPDNFEMQTPSGAPEPSRLAPTRSPRPRSAPAMLGEPVPSIGGGAAVADQMAGRLAALMASLQTEDEVIADWYQESLAVLEDALATRALTEEEYREQRERLEKEHQDRLNGIRAAGDATALGNTKSVMEGMLGIVRAGGERMISAQKAVSAVLALINTWEGVSKALTLPWPQNFAVAAKVLGQGMAAVSQIRGASSGGGGVSGGGLSGAAGAAPVMRQNIIIDMVGEQFSRQSVGEIFNQINEGLRSGYQIDGIMVR